MTEPSEMQSARENKSGRPLPLSKLIRRQRRQKRSGSRMPSLRRSVKNMKIKKRPRNLRNRSNYRILR